MHPAENRLQRWNLRPLLPLAETLHPMPLIPDDSQMQGGQTKQRKHSQLLPGPCCIDVSQSSSDSGGRKREKSRDQRLVPALSWLVARIKLMWGQPPSAVPPGEARQLPQSTSFRYAVLLGRTVKSRSWVRTLDICIPFSCDTNGRISAMNWSFTSSLISSWRLFSPPLSSSGTVTSRARASRSRDDSVGVAFSFSILET